MHFRKFNNLTKTALKLHSWPIFSQRRLGNIVKSFPLFVVFDVTLLSVSLEELVSDCPHERSNVCLHAVYIIISFI